MGCDQHHGVITPELIGRAGHGRELKLMVPALTRLGEMRIALISVTR